jgi:hypothetical protein
MKTTSFARLPATTRNPKWPASRPKLAVLRLALSEAIASVLDMYHSARSGLDLNRLSAAQDALTEQLDRYLSHLDLLAVADKESIGAGGAPSAPEGAKDECMEIALRRADGEVVLLRTMSVEAFETATGGKVLIRQCNGERVLMNAEEVDAYYSEAMFG